MANNSRITASELDFDAIKTNLKLFLEGQTQFQDYNFEGSGLSVILDLLAYNTQYRALYDNFIINEMFLDSASKRSNIVSRAKELGYTPRSRIASTALLKLTIDNVTNGPGSLTLPKNSSFNGVNGNNSYSFYTVEPIFALNNSGTYTFNNIIVKEGRAQITRFDVGPGVKYILAAPGIDITTLVIKIQDTAASNIYSIYTATKDIIGISRTDKIYWIKEILNGQYELEFGNGVIGKALVAGNIIQCEYFSTTGSDANGTTQFRYTGKNLVLGGVTNTETLTESYGGDDIETIESIKFNAPRFFSTQNRAVTTDDYKNIVYNYVPEAGSVAVWSGADSMPPQYGKVLICIKPKTFQRFTPNQKSEISKKLIQSKNVVSVIPEIVDPQYLKIGAKVAVYYNSKLTVKSPYEISTTVIQALVDYSTTQLENFESVFRASKLSYLIDNLDTSITSNICSYTLHRVIDPKYNVMSTYEVNVSNPVYNDGNGTALSSTGFYTNLSPEIMYLNDDGLGNIRLLYYVGPDIKYVNFKIGTINYVTGNLVINGLNIVALASPEFQIILKPQSYDIISVREQLISLDPDLISVEAIPDSTTINYLFSSSRS